MHGLQRCDRGVYVRGFELAIATMVLELIVLWGRLTRTIHAAVSPTDPERLCCSIVASETGRDHAVGVCTIGGIARLMRFNSQDANVHSAR